MAYERDIKTRFWNYVDIKDKNSCWEWKGSTLNSGYGCLTYNYKTVLAHVTAWRLTHIDFQKDKIILHKCDNRKCCNPAHLYEGTYSDNMNDRAIRNPNCQGGGQPKLHKGEIWLIRKIHDNTKLFQYEIAKMFKISQRTVNRIVNSKVYCKEGYYA